MMTNKNNNLEQDHHNQSHTDRTTEHKYYATYKRPPRPDIHVITRIGRLHPIAQCLDEALEELMLEQQQQQQQIEEDEEEIEEYCGDNGYTIKRRVEKIPIHAQFRQELLDHYGIATCHAFHDSSSSFSAAGQQGESVLGQQQQGDEARTAVASARISSPPPPPAAKEKKSTGRVVVEPPAALLHGKLKYYNRMGGQWRIVVTDAELRPRVNVDYTTRLAKSEQVSLKDMHDRLYRDSVGGGSISNSSVTGTNASTGNGMNVHAASMSTPAGQQSQRNSRHTAAAAAAANCMNPGMDERINHGVFKLEGDLVILACDDLCE